MPISYLSFEIDPVVMNNNAFSSEEVTYSHAVVHMKHGHPIILYSQLISQVRYKFSGIWQNPRFQVLIFVVDKSNKLQLSTSSSQSQKLVG